MAARKLNQEIEKCFKKVDEGVLEFENIHEKIAQSTNAAQKEKLEDTLKKEIKKLQRLRDQIKTWHTNSDYKDKEALIEKRKLIETQMERFKLVEKAMKTKAYSKEGLLAVTKLDPKDQARADICDFLNECVSRLEDQIQELEAESQGIQATMKRGKNTSKMERLAEIDKRSETHKWHQGKLELIKRSLENGAIEVEEVSAIQEDISYYVDDNTKVDFAEDDGLYDGLDLKEEEDTFGMFADNDKVSSQDAQSVQDEPEPERTNSIPNVKPKPAPAVDAPGSTTRRPSTQLKSPAPALATLHTPLSNITNIPPTMKPAAMPVRAPGETLKYASAAAAAAATEKNGIAPLPPPPEALPPPNTATNHPPLPSLGRRPSLATPSPKPAHSQLSDIPHAPAIKSNAPTSERPLSSRAKSPSLTGTSATSISINNSAQVLNDKPESSRSTSSKDAVGKAPTVAQVPKATSIRPNGITNGNDEHETVGDAEESVYHLPPGMQDLVDAYEKSQQRMLSPNSQAASRMLEMSLKTAPRIQDMSAPRTFKPENSYATPAYYPQELDSVFDEAGLYSRIDPDTLFYIFYYKQGTYQQYLAAKALKDQSWRFHKQYQTWFQRHEEPKNITEEYEQGTYRFFDYESTWMNRRKADFKFAYKFLEDVV